MSLYFQGFNKLRNEEVGTMLKFKMRKSDDLVINKGRQILFSKNFQDIYQKLGPLRTKYQLSEYAVF